MLEEGQKALDEAKRKIEERNNRKIVKGIKKVVMRSEKPATKKKEEKK